MRHGSLLVGVLLVLTVAGCSDDDDPVVAAPSASASASASATASATGSAEPSPSPTVSSSSPASSARTGPWVTQVNKLCDELIDPVVAVRGGEGLEPTRESYLAQKPEIDELTEDFDAKVDALEVSEDEQDAAAAFKAYREFVHADDDHLKEVADGGDEAAFQKQYRLSEEPYRIQRAKLAKSGITCPAY